MTKVSVFGQQPTETKELKKIEFVYWLNGSSLSSNVKNVPGDYDEVILICKSYFSSKYDLILGRCNGFNLIVYLGHWNDGVV